ncbi:uracil-DNA glycosylase family protein [Methylomagnum ishizawai]|uniref:uracil-DNA glycosylase family protein n=1 Tax=Methylomagnum ishizawai TaxID=1760988 RepID=UPI001C32DA0B|nr:uracil-DNA glycosylase family protein [Methylomagnum ishizawai]BBL76431.1 hypothetical protein MishRS11D_35290 [Methylomagnum ishizawai]
MENSKQKQYVELVQLRKKCHICEGLTNPSCYAEGGYDSCEIGPWTQWQGNLDAQLMVIGQDWGTPNDLGTDDSKNPTNVNLARLLNSIGINIQPTSAKNQPHILFFTNTILCLKEGGLQAPVKTQWIKNCGKNFLKQNIEIVKPKIVVALGRKTFEAILDTYKMPYGRGESYAQIVERGEIIISEKTRLFPVFHCGRRGMTNRNMQLQLNDWQEIGRTLVRQDG